MACCPDKGWGSAWDRIRILALLLPGPRVETTHQGIWASERQRGDLAASRETQLMGGNGGGGRQGHIFLNAL